MIYCIIYIHLLQNYCEEINAYLLSKERLKRQVMPIVKTYEEAETICRTAFHASMSYQTCQEYVTDLSNTSLVNCIFDVMVCAILQIEHLFKKNPLETALNNK